MPSGFRVQVFASGLGNPRMLAVSPEGDVYVTLREQGQVLRLRDLTATATPATRASGSPPPRRWTPALEGVHGISWYMGRVYLATIKSVLAATPVRRAADRLSDPC